MRNTSTSLIPVLATIVFLASCSKEINSPTTAAASQTSSSATQIINASVATDQSYSLAFDQSANVSVYKQAAHFSQSAAARNSETGKVTYTYVPASGFAGDDEVTLSKVTTSQSHSGGCPGGNQGSSSSSTSYVTVKITVTK